MEATVIFSNGQEINVEVNGSSLITSTKPDFPDDLTNVQIVSEENGTSVIDNGRIIECAGLDNRYWFTIIEIPASKVRDEEIDSRIANLEDALCEISTLNAE